jgi:hypothetical protein
MLGHVQHASHSTRLRASCRRAPTWPQARVVRRERGERLAGRRSIRLGHVGGQLADETGGLLEPVRPRDESLVTHALPGGPEDAGELLIGGHRA